MLIRFCTKCGHQIEDQARIRHRSPYCSETCRREARRELRAMFAQDRCRLCGRQARKKPPEDSPCIFHNSQGNLPLEANQPHQTRG